MLALTKLKDHICRLIRDNTTTLHSDELICYMYALIVAAGIGVDANNPHIPISIIKCEHYVDSYITYLGKTMRDAPLPLFIMLRDSQKDLLIKLPARITTVNNAVQLYYNTYLESRLAPTPELKYSAERAYQHAQECCDTIDIDMSTSNGDPQHLGRRVSCVYNEHQAKLHRFEYVAAKEYA